MPCNYRIFPDIFLLATQFEGDVSLKDILSLIDTIDADPAFKHGMLEFNDLSNLDRLRLTPEDISGISDLTQSLYRRGRLPQRSAYWAPNQFYMSASLYCSFFSRVQGADIKTFRDRADALKFLGVTEEQLAHV